MDMYRLQVINCRSQITHHRFVAIALQWIDHIAAYNAPSIRRHCITMNSTQFLERTMKVEIIVQETFHHSHNYGRQWNSLGPSLFTIVRVRFISWIFKLWSKIVGGSYILPKSSRRSFWSTCLFDTEISSPVIRVAISATTLTKRTSPIKTSILGTRLASKCDVRRVHFTK